MNGSQNVERFSKIFIACFPWISKVMFDEKESLGFFMRSLVIDTFVFEVR